MKSRAVRRKNDFNKAIRKKNIVENAYGWEDGYYKSLHQYSKNKIHCSCPLCSAKTDMNSKNNISHKDKVKLDSMNSQLKEM